jgi:membrane protease YdiL (CAAX protease family)
MAEKKFPFNIILLFFVVTAVIGLYWLSRLGLDAGIAYLWLFIIGVVFIVITTIADRFAKLDFWNEVPINSSSEKGLIALTIGILVLFLFFGISSITGANFYSPFVMAPLAQFGVGLGEQSFSALSAATSPFWVFFITVLSASVIEEIVLGWGFVTMGSLLLGLGFRRMLKLDFGEIGNDWWDFIMAMIFSVILFSILHVFNDTYLNVDGTLNIGLFTFAATFRLVLNIFIYKLANLGLLFSIGVHAVNNAVFVGGATVVAALTTFPGGVILDAIFILIIVFGILSYKKLWQELKDTGKDALDFE